jgi:hypothetical protein
MKNYFSVRAMMLIVTVTSVCMLIGLLLGITVFLKYKSEGILSMDMSVAEYKRFNEAAGDVATLRQTMEALRPADANDIPAIERTVFSVNDKWQMPLPRITKLDARDLPEILLKRELDNNELAKDRAGRVYVGARITALSQDPEQAARIAVWLGSYFREVAVREALREKILDWVGENQQFFERAQEKKLAFDFEIEQAQRRSLALKKVLSQYPELAKSDSRQVVEVRKDNEKFISPLAQMVGAEIEVIDIREKLSQLDRSLVQQSFAKSYLAEAQRALDTANTGSNLINALNTIAQKYSAKVTNEAQQEKLLFFAGTVSQISARLSTQAQFILPPLPPTRAQSPRPTMLAALFAFFGLLMSLAWVFRSWKRQL